MKFSQYVNFAISRYLYICYCLQNLADLVTFVKETSLKKQEIEQNTYLFFNTSSE